MMINETRILNEFIELVSVPCPSKDEKGRSRSAGTEAAGNGTGSKSGRCRQEDRRDKQAMCGPFYRVM